MAKQNVVAELFYGGAWHAESAYTRAPVVITRGRGDESGQGEPATASLTFDNRDGSKNPRNPSSPLYGLAGRNTPIRLSLTEATDAFGRTVAGSWGTADTGQAWTNHGVGGTVDASDFEVASGLGKHHVEVDNAYRLTYLGDVSMKDAGVVVTVDMVITNVLTNAVEPANIYFRAQDTSTYYLARVSVSAAEVVTAQLFHSTGGSLGSAQTVTGLTFDGSPLTVRAEICGSHLRMRVWAASGDEPEVWHAEATDTTLTAAGWVGIRSGVASGNTNTKPIEFGYDDLRVYDIRFAGEVSSWKPRRTVDFDAAASKGDAWTEIEASGVTRRLGQGASPLRSPLTRAGIRGNSAAFGVSGAPVVYWTCEDESGSTTAADVMGNAPPMGTRGDVQFAALSPLDASAPLPKFADADSRFAGTIPSSAYRSAWVPTDGTVVSFTFAIGEEAASALLLVAYFEDDAGSTWAISISLDGSSEDFDFALTHRPTSNPTSVTTLDSTIHSLARSLNTYHTFSLVLDQVGSDINWLYQIKSPYGVAVGGDTLAGVTLGRFRRVQFDAVSTLDALSFGHIMIHDRSTVSLSAMFTNTLGHAGETADERAERLAGEEGVSFTLDGTSGTGGLMGVQRIATLVDLLDDAEKVDQGILTDSRTSLGVTFRTLADLYNQAAALSLDYAGNPSGIAPGLEPDIDDLGVHNDVEVKRNNGSSARVTLDTGALSTQDPPNGVGRYDESVTVNAQFDAQLPGIAGWRLGLGTVDETRYPKVTVDLDAAPSLVADASALDVGDLITITNLPADDTPDDARLIVRGYTETIGSHRRTITYNCTPARAYDVGIWDDDDVFGRYDSAYSTVNTEFDAGTDTSLSVAVESGALLWVTGSGSPQFPLDILVDGVRLHVTAISGASSPQTFTVDATPVNGVEKTIAVGTQVRAWRPARYA